MPIITRFRSLLNVTGERSLSGEEGSKNTDRPESALFQCSDCDVVYIDTDKATCPNCGTTVTRVPSTLRPDGET